MRTNYNPFPQHDPAELIKIFAQLDVFEQEIINATDRMLTFMDANVSTMLRHHTASRPMVKDKLQGIRQRLQEKNVSRAQAMDRAWQTNMNEIEALRMHHHAEQVKLKAKAKREADERASVTVDPDTQQWSYTKQEEYLDDGVVKYRTRKVLLQPDHQWVLAKSGGR